jgi:hypothetical protein
MAGCGVELELKPGKPGGTGPDRSEQNHDRARHKMPKYFYRRKQRERSKGSRDDERSSPRFPPWSPVKFLAFAFQLIRNAPSQGAGLDKGAFRAAG